MLEERRSHILKIESLRHIPQEGEEAIENVCTISRVRCMTDCHPLDV